MCGFGGIEMRFPKYFCRVCGKDYEHRFWFCVCGKKDCMEEHREDVIFDD